MLKSDFAHPPAGVNPTNDPNWALDTSTLFPNCTIGMLDSGYFTHNFWPIAVDRTFWEMRMYLPRPRNAAERFSQEHARVTFRDVMMEDGSTMENSQSVLASGAKTHFNFQDEEILLRHDNKVLADYIGLDNRRPKNRQKSESRHAKTRAA